MSTVRYAKDSSRKIFLADVLRGLSQQPKTLPCKYFYDQRGSQIFDRICELDEYYLTRTETQIMRESSAEMADAIGPDATLIEFGSGSSTKSRLLLDAMKDLSVYVPVDISEQHLFDTAAELRKRYREFSIVPICADFTEPFDLSAIEEETGRRVVYFPGSTIGNLTGDQAIDLIESIDQLVGSNGGLLIGFDLVKEQAIIEQAYNDAEGVTAQFNLNILHRINDELDGDIDIQKFEHTAEFNSEEARIEMLLRSKEKQTISVGDERFSFAEGETICTEYSHKYDQKRIEAMFLTSELSCRQVWTDRRNWFAIYYFSKE